MFNLRVSETFKPWLVCFSAALFFFYEFIQMNMMNSIGGYLMAEYRISATQLGNLSGWYFYSNLLFLPIAGLLLDRVSVRKVVLAAMIACMTGTALMAVSHSLTLTAACRFISGIGGAFCFLSSMRIASRWFPPERMALITGLIVTMAMLGGVVAQTPLTLLCNFVGWRQALIWVAILGVAITALVWHFVLDYPPGQQAQHSKEKEQLKSIGFWKAKKLAFLNTQNWLAGLYTCAFNLPLALLGALWGNTYLQKIHHFSATQASFITTMIFLGTVIGSPLAGWLSDYFRRRKGPMLIGAILSLIIILSIIYLPTPSMPILLFLFFALGLTSSTQVISYPTVAESNPRALTATSVSVVSISVILGYPVFQNLFGMIMDWNWDGTLLDGVHVYSAANYQLAATIMPIVFVMGIIAAWFIKETYCNPKEFDEDKSSIQLAAIATPFEECKSEA